MHQQFLNSPMKNCDPQMYLGQGHFRNCSHPHRGHSKPSALTLTDLEEVARIRTIQPLLFPGPLPASSSVSGARRNKPVDTSELKCPIIMMNNPFQHRADREKAVGAVCGQNDPVRDISCVRRDMGLDRTLFPSSEHAAVNPNNRTELLTYTLHASHHNDATGESTHRASQYHPVSSSRNQFCRMPQSKLCDCSHDNNNEAQITEFDNLYFPVHTHQHVLHQTDLAAHFPPHGQHQTDPAAHFPPHGQHQTDPAAHFPPHGQHQTDPAAHFPPHGQHQTDPAAHFPPHGQHQTDPAAHFPPHSVFWQGKQPRRTDASVYTYSHGDLPHNMDMINQTDTEHSQQHPRMVGDLVTNNLGVQAFNPVNDSRIYPNMTSQPMFLGITSSQYGRHHGTVRIQDYPTTEGHHHGTVRIQDYPTTEGHHHGTVRIQDYPTTEEHHLTNGTGCHVTSIAETSPRDTGYRDCRQLQVTYRGHLPDTNIRVNDRCNIESQLVPGKVLQVHGAPMTGKSTLVRQAISDAISRRHQTGQLCDHHITCKGVSRFQDFLSLIAQSWCPQHSGCVQSDTDSVLKIIHSFLQQDPLKHHVLVFHKCENLRENPNGQHFLEFLTRIVHELATLSVSVVFTTYKHYWTPASVYTGEAEVNVLSVVDIITLLQYYVPDIDYVSYANVLVKTFCFPEAVRLIAEVFLADTNCRVKPEMLEKIINKDSDFLSQLFESRLQEVDTWVSKKDLLFLAHFKNSIENSFTEAHLEYVNSSDLDQVHLQKIICHLKKNHVVRSLPGIRRLVIHPLIVYHSMMAPSRDRQLLPEKWYDNTCNRYTYFLGRVLMSIEANMQEHGRKGLVFAGLIQEWPNVQYVFQMALHCNINTYSNFIKVAVTASNYILKIFPREAESFYWSLYNSARVYGTSKELAVMEAFLGQAIAEGTGKDWSRANRYLSSAIEHLSTFGNSYFLAWAIIRKAIILHRQGKYLESIEYFQLASHVLNNVDRWALGELFVVPEPKIDEEMITQRIHMTIPIIFTGRNKEARKRLDNILKLIENYSENHPDIATLLNLIGLTEQRGNRDKERALIWYKLSYNERMYWAKACPESLLAVLNNIGMIYFYQGNSEESMKYLEKALDIRRECGWTHYNTGLTLVHVAEINMKSGNLVQAYKSSLEAERIFAATVKDHDMRLRVNYNLAHLRVLIRQALEPQQNVAREFPSRMQSHRNYGQPERASEAKYTQGRGHGAEGNGAHDRPGQRKTSWDTTDDSVTSSQLFQAGYDSHQEMNTSCHHHQQQQSDNSSQPSPAHEDIIGISATEIEACDLRMSVGDYFERLLTIASSIQGTLSDDGLSLVLCSHEHQMLLNLGNSPDKFEKHRMALFTFSADNPWLEVNSDTDTGVDSKYRCLVKHKPLYNYALSTPYENLNVRTFIEHMLHACLTCNFVSDAFSMETWEAEAIHCIQEREVRMRRMQEFDRIRSYPESEHGNAGNDAASSTDLDIVAAAGMLVFQELDQNYVSNNMIFTQNSLCRKSALLLQQVRDLPNFEELLSPSGPEIQLQVADRGTGQHHPTIIDQSRVHRQSSQTLCQSSSVLPRIANTQEEILKRIQSSKGRCSHSASMEAEKGLPDSSSICRKTSSDRRSTTVSGFMTSRKPVEQSYHGDQDLAWSRDDSLLSERDRKFSREASACDELHKNKVQPIRESQKQTENLETRKDHVHDESGIASRQALADSDHQNILTDHHNIITDHQNIPADLQNIPTDRISDKVLPEDLSKSRLVLEICTSDWTSQSDSTSGADTDHHSSTGEQKYGKESSQNKTCKASEDGKFSALEYIKNGFNINVSKSAQSETSAGESYHEESESSVWQTQQSEQKPSEEHQVTRVQDEKIDGKYVTLHVSSSSSLFNTTVSLSSQPHVAAPYSENGLHLQTVPAVHECVTERKPQSKQPQLLVQCVDNAESLDDSRYIPDSGLDSVLVHNMNVLPTRQSSSFESNAFSRRSRVVSSSSSSSSSSGHRALSHMTSTLESGYSSEQHLTGMSKTRPVRCALPGARYHNKYCPDSHNNQGFGDIPLNSSDGLPTEVGHANAVVETTSGRLHTETDNILTALGYAHTLASVFSQGGMLQQHSREHQHPSQQEGNSQIDNQATGILSSLHPHLSVFAENSNSPLSFREPVEQSWNETLVPNFTQHSEVNDMSEPGHMIRQELRHLEQRIRQRESESSADSEEVTLAENVRSSL